MDLRGPPPVHCYTVARGRLPRREYIGHRKLPLEFFPQPLQSSRIPLVGHYPTGNRNSRDSHEQPVRVFHQNTFIMYNSTSNLALNRMDSRNRRTVMKGSHSKKLHDHGTSPCRQGLAARRTATYFSLVANITNERKHMAHPYIRDHRRRPRRPPWGEGQQTDKTLIVESRQTLRRVESVGIGVTSSMRPIRMPERARARRAL
jgi:hypothetical protein